MAYPDRLEAAWRDHLAPRADDAPTVVSLFAGCGGSSLGYSMAGFDERLAVEWDEQQAASFATNFPHVPLFFGDVTKLTDDEALRLARLEPGELDVLDGSPPCQGFSTAGQRHIDDPRSQLFNQYVRLLRAFRPRMFIMENVRGMVIGKMRLTFALILRELKACGYTVSARVLTAGHYGVPQLRGRMIFIGVRDDLAARGVMPSHPQPTGRLVTVREAIFDVVNTDDEIEAAKYPPASKYLRYLMHLKPGEKDNSIHPKGHYFNLSRLAWDDCAPTIMKNGGNRSWACEACHPEEHRKVTIAELKRIGSFPDQFVLRGDFRERWAAVGNCVPPLFMRAIAFHVKGLLTQMEVEHAA
jgi:DNA (cytosine-5)-methyltransferase 1